MLKPDDKARDHEAPTQSKRRKSTVSSVALVPLSISLGTAPERSMDALFFIAEIVKAIAWPVATLAIALIFRAQFVALLTRLRRGKMGSAEFEFEQEVRELVQMAPQAPPSTRLDDPVVTIAAGNPRTAIIEAWLRLEGAVNRLAYLINPSDAAHLRSPLQVMNFLRKDGRVSEEDAVLFKELRSLRNQSAHDENFTPSLESVLRFVQLANGLYARLSRINTGQ